MELQSLPELAEPKHVAQILGISVQSVTKLCRTGELPARQFGRSWRILRDKLIAQVYGTEEINASK